MQIFDPEKGIVAQESVARDVSKEIGQAVEFVRTLRSVMPVEGLVKEIQSRFPVTNQEAFDCIVKVDAEIKGKEVEPVVEVGE